MEEKVKDIIKDHEEAPNPYIAGRREWNERYGSYIKQAHNWKLATFCSLIVSLIAVTGLAYVATQSKFVPYVIQMKDGNVDGVVFPAKSSFSNKKFVRAALAQWITNLLSVSSDKDVQKMLIANAYTFLGNGRPATQSVNDYFQSGGSPFRRMSSETAQITVESVLPISEKSWEIEWKETVKSKSGVMIRENRWKGAVVLSFATPKNHEIAIKNPMGLYIDEFNWTKRL